MNSILFDENILLDTKINVLQR